MGLTAGQHLGPYEIVAPLGAGGMGEVYRARDTKLHRDVAVKVLAATLARDPAALARFEREAQSVAQLSHPNILAIHDFGSDDGVAYAVTELLDGETLRERLSSGPLPSRKAVEYALQIAHGLAAAHDKGIVHRDLKPDNVFVTRDGRVKILDFGLAKPIELPSAGATMTRGVGTASGTVLGTFGYMAPEQVRAQPVDHRADIFAFGALLYEMLSGRRAFAGDTPADTLSAILHADPPDSALAAERLPPALDRIIRRALDKKPELRFQSAHDLAFALENVSIAASTSSVPVNVPERRPALWRRALAALPWAVAAGALASGGWMMSRSVSPAGAGLMRFDLALPSGIELHVFGGSMAISPDGRTVALIGTRGGSRSVYVRRLDAPDPTIVKGTDTAFRLFFSPDGQQLGVICSDGSPRIVTLGSGLVTPLAERSDFFGATWTTGDRIVFTRDRRLWHMAASGAAAARVPVADNAADMSFPFALPDPDKILVAITRGSSNEIAVASISTGALRTLVTDGEVPVYSPSGHLIFLRSGTLTAVRFDARKLEVTGPQVPVLEGLPPVARAAPFALSATGTLVFIGSRALQSHIVWVNREGAERALTRTPRQYTDSRVSPDGRYVMTHTTAGELWVYDTTRDTLSRLATAVPIIGFPIWMPGGREVIYKSAQGVHRQEIDGARHSQVPGSMPNDYPSAVSADGRSIAVVRLGNVSSADIYILSATGAHEPRPWLATPAYDGGPRWSPDGQWMAYSSLESGQSEVYLQPYPGPGVRRQVSVDGGSHPVWARDGRELFYRQNSRVYAVGVESRAADVTLSQPRLLFDRLYGYGRGISIPNYDVSADGRDLAFVKDSGATHLNVIVNWFSELQARTQ